MAKLTKHPTFEALKTEGSSHKATQDKDHKLLSEFEAFLLTLQNKYANKKKGTTNTNGK